jgi:hypothetical protein
MTFLKEHKEFIYDVYFTCRIAPFEQDAMGDVFLNSSDDLLENALIIQDVLGIPISATFNNIYVRPSQKNLDLWIKNFIPLYERGIRSCTLPHSHWVATGQIQKKFPDLYIKNTILREINTAADMSKQVESGFNYINIDRDLMRDRDTLEKIKKVKTKFNIKVALLANEGCIGSCPMMEEHYHFNCTRTNGPQYFTDVISRVSCPKWEIKDPSSPLKTANVPPWKEDWDELLQYIDVFKMHGRESITQLWSSMSIIHNYSENKEILYNDFNEYLNETNLIGNAIKVWRKTIKNCKFDCWDCNKCEELYNLKSDLISTKDEIFITDTICTIFQD